MSNIYVVCCFRLLLCVKAPAYYVNLLRSLLFSVAPLCNGSTVVDFRQHILSDVPWKVEC
jgi:hypothetical protein